MAVQPRDDGVRREHGHVAVRITDHKTLRSDNREYRGDLDWASGRSGEDPFRAPHLVLHVADVRVANSRDHEGALGGPDIESAVVLGRDNEYTGRADNQVIDVGVASIDR